MLLLMLTCEKTKSKRGFFLCSPTADRSISSDQMLFWNIINQFEVFFVDAPHTSLFYKRFHADNTSEYPEQDKMRANF